MWNYNPKNLKEFKKCGAIASKREKTREGGGNPSLELFNHNA